MSAPDSSSRPRSKNAPRQNARRARSSSGDLTTFTETVTIPPVRFLPAVRRMGCALACALVVLALAPAAGAGTIAWCGGERANVVGTSGADTLYGTPGNDVIYAGGGNDRVYAGGGHDTVCAEAGDDLVRGGGGDDGL